MIDFAIPLIVLGSLLSCVSLLLLAPPPFSTPAILLCRSTKTSAGWTVACLSTVLAIMSASHVWDIVHMRHHSQETSADSLQRRSVMTESQLFCFVLTAACLVLILVVRKLGMVMSQRDSLTTSQQAMLKQVEGLRTEYNRVTSSQSKADAAAGSKLDSSADSSQLKHLQARLNEALEDRRKAKGDADALKSQSKGLEKEYDRLLSENDELKRKLSRYDASSPYSARNKKGE